ncbi:MAG: GNAT family N-acetyltransferase [Clostridia bacterium]|nr:GNAT family N-acetyltransferase [Clostridia bacterium]
MIEFKKCSDVSDEAIFETFREGFSDYFFKFEMTPSYFIDHFFGAEGNRRELSLVAYKHGQAVGILLGGLRSFEGMETLRCGAMAVIPKGRKKGVAKALMAAHEEMAREMGIDQMFLEVLTVNDSAYTLYQSLGYEKVYDLTYRIFEPEGFWFDTTPASCLTDQEAFYSIQEVTLTDLEGLRHIDESHLPWQGSFEYMSQIPVEIYGVYKNGQLIAGLVGSDKKLYYLYVAPNHRRQGIAKALIMTYLQVFKMTRCELVYTNNAKLHTFANHLKMSTATFGQYEYYKWLD